MKKLKINEVVIKHVLVLFFGLAMLGCSSEDDNYNPNPDPDIVNSIRLRNDSTFGSVLTNAEGFTLYFFAPDAKGDANCLGGCADVWPAFFSENLTIDNGLIASDFGIITRSDGQSQTTYKGWPLYSFANDTASEQINGDGSGGVWFVGKPDYSVMLVRSQLIGRDSNGNETNLNSSFVSGDEDTFYITDDRGNTLYHFSNDTDANNTFTASDFSNNGSWPIFHVELQSVPSSLNPNGFGVIDVFGESQMTYKGWPLYNFGGDDSRGDNFGVGFPVAGVWPILNVDTELAPESVENTTVVFEVSNVGASAYVFDFTNDENPGLELIRGNTYEFNVNSPGHPFFIKSIQSTGVDNAFNDGVTNNGIADGTIVFTVPSDAPDTLFYNCEFHGSMTGVITIID
jgi:predicted lipoprotein with Yx(FWY)xxD motif